LGELRYLAIETSGRIGRAGLGLDGQLIAERLLDETRRHARDLMPICRALLQKENWKPADLSAVVVSLGPGSYTGLRVGIMAAKAMAYVLNCRLIGIPTFEVFARQGEVDRQKLDVIGDALKEKLYVQRFARSSQDARWTPDTKLTIVSISEWLAGLSDSVAVTGPGLRLVADRIPRQIRIPSATSHEAGLAALLALGHERIASADASAVFSLEPIYLRPSSAEEQWADRSGQT
jgi:tRNA threonylcarbamoyladenosine biosynthesis protein TsaB